MLQIQSSDVIITDIRNNAQGELEFVMYIQVAGGAQVLAVGPLQSAVQVNYVQYCFRILLPVVVAYFRLDNIWKKSQGSDLFTVIPYRVAPQTT